MSNLDLKYAAKLAKDTECNVFSMLVLILEPLQRALTVPLALLAFADTLREMYLQCQFAGAKKAFP